MKNLFLVNAPAGSGKTYFIKDEINRILTADLTTRVLCITYTERAASELKSRIISDNVEISTIHSFMNRCLRPFFMLPEVIDFYIDNYKDKIKARISTDLGVHANRYKERMKIDTSTQLTIEIIRDNITTLYYNELPNNSYFYGGISHDELLIFSLQMMERFPILKLKVRELYQYIFIDEVQDTSSDILNFFYYAVKDNTTQLFLFGDKMQEIYDKYDGTFEVKYDLFDNSLSNKFNENYRSSKEILRVLSNLYVSKLNIKQESNMGNINIFPKIIICDSITEHLQLNAERYFYFLQLRTLNRHRFESFESKKSLVKLYEGYNTIYPRQFKIKVLDVLLPKNHEESPDLLLNFIFLLDSILNHFRKKEYGELIQKIKSANYTNEYKKKTIFNLKKLSISHHKDKKMYKEILEKVNENFNENNENPIFCLLESLLLNEIITKEFYRAIVISEVNQKFKYTDILHLPVYTFIYLILLKESPKISTQHGVKGEGHEKVLFVSEDSANPSIKIYEFFRLFSQNPHFNLDDFQKFYYEFSYDIKALEKKIGGSVSKIKAVTRDQYESEFEKLYSKYSNNLYFQEINCKGEVFKHKQNLSILKKMFNITNIRGTLVAYKLFYVGCSRAEKELIVLIKRESIQHFSEQFIKKMKSIGFEVKE